MILYHGSSVTVEIPDLNLSRKTLDFGAGFYTTVSIEQAAEFARKVMIRKRHKDKIISIYEFDWEKAKTELDILQFQSSDKDWLDFVHQNRRGLYTGRLYDLVMGPVANDDVFATLIIYEQGILNVEQTLESLKIKKLYSQFVFKTEKALSSLKFIKSLSGESML